MIRFLGLSISTFLFVQSCGDLANLSQKNENYSYQFNVNGCDTGYRSFASRESMCESLKDNTGNYNCAYNERYVKFQNDCYDKQW